MSDFWYSIKMGLFVVSLFFASLPSSCQQEAFDTEKYESYRLYDCFLVCQDWESEARSKMNYSDSQYSVVFRKVKGESDDQFICANIADYVPFTYSGWYVLQNPDNYVDVWSDWTVREIQIYTTVEAETGSSDAYTENIIVTTASQLCAQELSLLNRAEPVEPPDTPSVRLSELRIRVIFQESESIIWDSFVRYQRNTETGEIMVYVATDATQWDGIYSPNGELISGIYFDHDMNWLSDSPHLKEFLLEAREIYLENA